MPTLSLTAQCVARDKSLHSKFTCMVHAHLDNCGDTSIAHKIISDAVQLEQKFFRGDFPF